jgi:hypothetical protein
MRVREFYPTIIGFLLGVGIITVAVHSIKLLLVLWGWIN